MSPPSAPTRDRVSARRMAALPPWAARGAARSRRRADVRADRIFISYRRADSGGWARSLHDNLEEGLGTGRAFRDVTMEGGVDFHEHVEALLDRCDVLLAIIGRRWSAMVDAHGSRRLDDPDDLVRREIAGALKRADVEVIPVLVDGARMPAEHELPADLAPLARRQACELTDTRWDYDVDILTQRLRVLLGEKPPHRIPARSAAVGALIALVAVFLAQAAGRTGDQDGEAQQSHPRRGPQLRSVPRPGRLPATGLSGRAARAARRPGDGRLPGRGLPRQAPAPPLAARRRPHE